LQGLVKDYEIQHPEQAPLSIRITFVNPSPFVINYYPQVFMPYGIALIELLAKI
jgi:hypothetical protein